MVQDGSEMTHPPSQSQMRVSRVKARDELRFENKYFVRTVVPFFFHEDDRS